MQQILSIADRFPRHRALVELVLLFGILFVCLNVQGIMLESIFSKYQFQFGWFAAFFEALVFAVFTVVLQYGPTQIRQPRLAPLWTHGTVAMCIASTRGLTLMSLTLITYPTMMLIKSCKLIVVMGAGILWFRKRFNLLNYAAAFVLIASAALFALGDSQTLPSFHPIGVALVGLSLLADAVQMNMQEHILKVYRASEGELFFWSNALGVLILGFIALLSGEWTGAVRACQRAPLLLVLVIGAAVLAFLGGHAWVRIIHDFGAATAAVISNARKVVSLVLSFLLFPKPLVMQYLLGASLFVAGLALHSKAEERKTGGSSALPGAGMGSGSDGVAGGAGPVAVGSSAVGLGSAVGTPAPRVFAAIVVPVAVKDEQ